MRLINDRQAEITVFYREWTWLTGERRQSVLEARDRFETAWEILRDSPTMRMTALVGGPWWKPGVPITQSWPARVAKTIRKAVGRMFGRSS